MRKESECMAYSFSGRVRYSEIGENGLLTLPGILNYFQDCSTFQSEEVGLGIDILKEWKRIWVLSAWQVVVDRYPYMGERIKTSTWHMDSVDLWDCVTLPWRQRRGTPGVCQYFLDLY